MSCSVDVVLEMVFYVVIVSMVLVSMSINLLFVI